MGVHSKTQTVGIVAEDTHPAVDCRSGIAKARLMQVDDVLEKLDRTEIAVQTETPRQNGDEGWALDLHCSRTSTIQPCSPACPQPLASETAGILSAPPHRLRRVKLVSAIRFEER